MLTKAQIHTINDIIFHIHADKDFNSMRLCVLESLKYVIPYSGASFYIASGDETAPVADPVGVGMDDSILQDYIETFDMDYTKQIYTSGKSMAFRERDFFPLEAIRTEEYYTTMYEPFNIKDVLTVSFAQDGAFLGVMSLFRDYSFPDFSEEETFMVSLLLQHFEKRISEHIRENTEEKTIKHHIDVHNLPEGIVLTNRELEIMQYLLEGDSVEEICSKCSISNNTMRKHTMNIYKKLDIHSRNELNRLLLK